MKSTLKLTTSSLEKDHQIVQFDGDFDTAGFNDVKPDLDKIILNFKGKNLIFDFTKLQFINSSGIGYLMEVHAHLIKGGRTLVIVGSNDHVKDVFDAVGIAEIVKFYDKLDDFLKI
ncbi:MAG: STAS domain-containing protein [Candidatus Gracilibacteria bacterium]|jgi:stage II sporulation protein AA (anti-sigma F factor antagonist)